MRLPLLFIFIASSLLAFVFAEEGTREKPVKKRRKALQLLKGEEEGKVAKVPSYSEEDDERFFQRGNKYKDVSDEDDSDEVGIVRGKKSGIIWNKSFKNHKHNTYEEFDKKTGAFKGKYRRAGDDRSSEEEEGRSLKPDTRGKVDKEKASKYSRSKNDKSKESKSEGKNYKGKKRPQGDTDDDSDEVKAKVPNKGKKGDNKLKEVKALENSKKHPGYKPKRKDSDEEDEDRSFEQDKDKDDNDETDEESDEDDDDDDESDDDESDDDFECDSLEENCDVKA